MPKSDSSTSLQLGSYPEQEIIFSSRDGYVWVSWPGTSAAMRLGRSALVAYMIKDFLAQEDLATRLMVHAPSCGPRTESD